MNNGTKIYCYVLYTVRPTEIVRIEPGFVRNEPRLHASETDEVDIYVDSLNSPSLRINKREGIPYVSNDWNYDNGYISIWFTEANFDLAKDRLKTQLTFTISEKLAILNDIACTYADIRNTVNGQFNSNV
jgi:hypothetical protein